MRNSQSANAVDLDSQIEGIASLVGNITTYLAEKERLQAVMEGVEQKIDADLPHLKQLIEEAGVKNICVASDNQTLEQARTEYFRLYVRFALSTLKQVSRNRDYYMTQAPSVLSELIHSSLRWSGLSLGLERWRVPPAYQARACLR